MTHKSVAVPPPAPSPGTILAAWRERIFFAIFLTVILMAVVPYISSALGVIHEKKWATLAVYTLGYLSIIVILLLRRIPFQIRVMIGLGTFYSIGLTALISLGLIGSGRMWLFAFSIIASLLLGLGAGFTTLALNTATLVFLGYLLAKGQLPWAAAISDPMEIWIIVSITFILLNTVATVSLGVLVNALEKAILQGQEMTLALRTTNEQLERDHRKRRLAENELTQSQKKLTQAIQGNSIPTFIIDNNHIVTHWNNACEKLLGFSGAEMIGTNKHLAIFHSVEKPTLGDAIIDGTTEHELKSVYKGKIHKSNLTRGAYESEAFYPRLGTRGKWLYCTASPLRDPDQNIIGAIETIQDLTERKNTEEQLRQAQKMESVGRLAGGVAHDYNNALSVIIGFAELALDTTDLSQPLREDLNEILNAARRATDITRQLLAFARKQTIVPKVIDLNENISSMLKMLQRLIGENISLTWLPGKEIWPIKIDPTQMDQILANLCVNARDAINGVGKITLETDTVVLDDSYCADNYGFIPGAFVMLTLSDTGCGMDKSILDNIFEPFFTTKTADKGTGLGLATVYGIVKQNNGFIKVYSEPGTGTTVKIYLPPHDGHGITTPEDRSQQILTGHNETILIVEDDPPILRLAEQVLGGLGYRVLTAGTPEMAMGQFEKSPDKIQLLVTDVIMPQMNGRELATHLQTICPDLKCLFMSGYTANVIAHHGVLDQGVNFVQKPFSKHDLAKTVRKVLDGD